jgi:hypothetical protein
MAGGFFSKEDDICSYWLAVWDGGCMDFLYTAFRLIIYIYQFQQQTRLEYIIILHGQSVTMALVFRASRCTK